MQIRLIAQDKANHLTYGAAVAFVLLLACSALAWGLAAAGMPPWLTLQRAAIGTQLANVAVAAWKEWVYDAARPAEHTVDPRDFAATVLGGLLVTLPALAWGAQ